jgi:hypothetical protein
MNMDEMDAIRQDMSAMFSPRFVGGLASETLS